MIAKKALLMLKLSNSATLTFKGENGMKKLVTLVFAMLLTGSLAFAQNTPPPTKAPEAPKTTGKKGATKTSKAHKGGKKGKKSSGGTSTTTPK
jgi:hypothetical protein